MRKLLLAAAIAAAVLAAGLTRIADLDFWWHLRTGQLIVATHSIPTTDVYSYTAFGHEYVDHEWLFQVMQYATYSAFGPAGIALLKCLLFAATLIVVAFYAVDRGVDPVVAGGLAFLSIAGGITRFIERPELFSTLFAVLTYICADSFLRTRDWRWLAALPVICAVWSNVHAAVIVGLIIQLLFVRSLAQGVALATSVAASCLNPFGYRVLTVPFELTRIINSGVLDNQEWRHPALEKVPFYFVTLLLTGILLVSRFEIRDSRFVARIGVAAFLAYISLRYVRNVGLFSVFMPMLVAEEAARLRGAWRNAVAALGVIALGIVLTIYFPFERGFGEARYFPDDVVRFVKSRDLRGHMLNSYSFGGYLIWNLYPERRVFIDGRNEVYLPLMQRLKSARADSRAWNALLRDYAIDYALLEYVDEPDRITTIDSTGRAITSFAPFTVSRFPRARWALVDWGDNGMVFVRRGGPNSTDGEYDAIFPEGRGYQQHLVASGAVDRARVIAQLQRKIAEDPECMRARWLLASIQKP
ncbi:MAG TPA: hypothetical protein VLV78_03725 [Thermoanaerobaculia bacterium]|nr:hypothetical protein [Thermoanaerobaculia bacterium]